MCELRKSHRTLEKSMSQHRLGGGFLSTLISIIAVAQILGISCWYGLMSDICGARALVWKDIGGLAYLKMGQ